MNLLIRMTRQLRDESDPKVISSGPSSLQPSDRLARYLGWFSITLGLAEFLAPGRVARNMGLRGGRGVVRLFGLREIMAGVLTLSTEKETGLRSRVAGDLLDIAALAAALRSSSRRGAVAGALLLVGGVTMLDWGTAQELSDRRRRNAGQQRSYRDRSGFPLRENARGATADFDLPAAASTAAPATSDPAGLH